jgi:hypothetical protein
LALKDGKKIAAAGGPALFHRAAKSYMPRRLTTVVWTIVADTINRPTTSTASHL